VNYLLNAVNNSFGAAASATNPQFYFARSLMGTPTSNSTFGSAGQVVNGMNQDVPDGYSNYNGGYVSFKTSGWRGSERGSRWHRCSCGWHLRRCQHVYQPRCGLR